MHVCLDLVIPRNFSSQFKELVEEYAAWGDGSFRQDPPRYCWRDSVCLVERSIPAHIERLLPAEFTGDDMMFLSLEGAGLDEWEHVLNSKEGDLGQIPLRDMLLALFPALDRWALVFDLNCDQIDNVYSLSPHQLVEKIESVLTWGRDEEGFIGHARQAEVNERALFRVACDGK
jgi:hypothetical protein